MKYDHHEYQLALFYVSSELDMPDRVLQPIRHLVDYSLGRIFWRDWLRSDEIDPEWIPTPGDHDDPQWHRVDGWPERGGEYLHRKWSRRAQLWMQWHSVDAWHVIDWLVTARADGHAWLVNVDDQGRPKKLLKCGSIDRLVHEATKGLRDRNARLARDVVLGPNDEHFVQDLGARHTLVRLRSRAALRKEGALMRHCIGQGRYEDLLDDPDVLLLSVRDPDGRPLATLDIRSGFIRQFRSRSNAEPSASVKDLVVGAAELFGWRDWRERPGPCADDTDYGPEAAVILRGLPPARRRG